MAPVLQLISDTDRRGPQVASVDIAAALARRGVAVETAALAAGTSDARVDVPVAGPLRDTRRLRALRARVRGSSVVLAQGSTTLWGSVIATTGAGRPFVYRSIGDAGVWAHDGLRRAKFTAAIRRAAGVVALWPAAADALVETFGVERARISVITQAAPADRFAPITAPERAAARHALGLPPDAPVAIYVGSLSFEKRVDLAIDALAALPDLHLVVTGHGPLRADLERRAGSEHRRTHFTGPVADSRSVLAAADVLVLPSDTEGVPGVIVEAGLCGIPAVATAVGGVPDTVDDGITGVVVPRRDVEALADGIARALADNTMGLAARSRFLETHTTEAVAGQWEEVLGRVAVSWPDRAI